MHIATGLYAIMTMSDSTPEWATGDILRACQPELIATCDWPDCNQAATYEIEFSVAGQWEAHQVCAAHGNQLDVSIGVESQ